MNIIFEKKLILLLLLTLILIFPIYSIVVAAAQPFNIEIELPDSYTDVNPGSDVWFTIKLLNLANTQRVDVTLNYDIMTIGRESIVHNSKTVAIETQASFVADLKVPENALPGDYIINVVVNSSLGDSSAKTSLKVSTPRNDLRLYYVAAGVVCLILLIFLLIKSKPILEKLRLKIKIDRIVKEKLKKR